MADYSQQVADLQAAATICERHKITQGVNGIQPDYPRWPEAWAACEIVWRNYLDMETMNHEGDEADRPAILIEAGKLR